MSNTAIRIVPLGTGGFIPTPVRETAAVLVRRAETALLFDAGTGVARLLDPKFRAELDGVEKLNVLLSHYHLDHVIGLTWMAKLWDRELQLFVPSEPLVETTAERALERLTDAPLFALPLHKFPFPTRVFPLVTEEPITVGNFTIRVMRQRHSGGSIGFRVEDRFAYITDTDPDENHVSFLRGVQVAFMDAMYDSDDYKAAANQPGHKADHGSHLGVSSIAKQSGVSRLGLIHINPSYSESRCQAMIAESVRIFPSTFVPDEGSPIII